ncbi:DJ-1/PfpI family protein [Brassicibacter mesophilus]|uniref:DJ-1/PfpI family protein n=1 Tax=Brassicibacter mesophilus TaxID=745119 RepID=UPI003D198D89
MRSYILIYEGFVQFEVILASYFLKTKGEIITVGVDESRVTSAEGFITVPHITIGEVDVNEVDIFIIPGGEPGKLLENVDLHELLIKLNNQNKAIGAICAAPIHLAKSTVLKGKKYTTTLPIEEFKEFQGCTYLDENVVVDDNIITAKASGYVDFAIEIGKVMDIYENEEDLEETIRYFKYFNKI